MKIIPILNGMLVLTSGIGFSIQQVRAQQKPHIILIMADQHRGDALGCMGNPAVISPNIDKLSEEGTLFCNRYSSTPSSTPARAGLLTGMSPWRHGMLGYGRVAMQYRYEMPAMLREQNYYTFGIGKMHWSPQKSLHGFHGTLLDEKEGIVPESTVRALHQAKKNGHLLFLCTGRCKSIWPKDILEIGFDGVVGGCGTNIFYHGEELLHATLPKELQREVANSLTRYHIDGVLEGQETAYFRRDYWMPVVKSIFEENGTFSAKCQLFWEDANLNFDKMALWFDESSDMKSFKKQWENTFDFILRDPTFYEVVPKGYSKATGIDFLCKRLEIDRAHTVGIGDSTNDLPMLDFTGISIAMGSGNPDIFPSVDYVTAAVMEDGIEKALKHYQLIE